MSKEVVLLDDDDSDGDIQEIVPSSSTSNNIVDLTAGGGAAVLSSRKKQKKNRRKSAPSKLSEVQFVGVAAGQQQSTTSNNNAAFRNNNSDDIVEFAGVKRPRHSATSSQNNQFSNAPPSQYQPQSFTNNHFASANGTNNTNGFGGRGGHNNGGAASSRHSFPNSQFGRGSSNNYPNDMLDETIGSSLARFGRGAASNIANVGSSVFNAGLNMLEDVTLPDNSGRNRTNQQQFGRGRGNTGRTGNSYIDQLLGASGLTNDGHNSTIWERQHEQQRRSGGQGMKKRKAPPSSKSKGKTEEQKPSAMEKGKGLQKPQGFDALDMYYPRLKANERTLILHNMILSISSSANNSSASTNIQSKYTTKKFVHEWRVKFEKNNSKPTLWSLAKVLSDEIIRLQQQDDNDDNQKMPANKKKNGKENKSNMKQDNDTDDILVVDSEGKEKKVTLQIGPVSGDILDSLSKYFVAYLNKSKHKSMLDAIEPCQENGLTCSICADEFNPEDTVPCGGLDDIHFYCKGCLSSYCTVTVQSGPIQTMSCPLPSCKALFATADIKSTLSQWDTLMIEHREDGRDRRVALGGEAILHCECGVVAVVTKEDMGDGRITCPGDGCGKRYCAKCGNEDHGKDPCPPPAETLQWLGKNSKPCPNCKNPIEKNGGCDHMTCRPPMGCGHEFWFSCGCNYRGKHTCGKARF